MPEVGGEKVAFYFRCWSVERNYSDWFIYSFIHNGLLSFRHWMTDSILNIVGPISVLQETTVFWRKRHLTNETRLNINYKLWQCHKGKELMVIGRNAYWKPNLDWENQVKPFWETNTSVRTQRRARLRTGQVLQKEEREYAKSLC